MKKVLEADRIYLREMTEADLEDLAQMLMDPQVMYAYDHPLSAAETKAWLERQLDRYKADGFGLWAVIKKDTGAFVGQTGLTHQQCEGETILEVGYLFKKAYWHNGYAIEAAKACKAYAKEQLQAEALFAIINAENIASQKVAMRLGMQVQKEFYKEYSHGLVKHFLFGVELCKQRK